MSLNLKTQINNEQKIFRRQCVNWLASIITNDKRELLRNKLMIDVDLIMIVTNTYINKSDSIV